MFRRFRILIYFLVAGTSCTSAFGPALPRLILGENIGAAAAATFGITKQYAPDAVSLFNNMKTPASILAGALVTLGFVVPIEPFSPDKKERKFEVTMRKLYVLVAIVSLLSELAAIIWSTVTVNTLTETAIKPTTSVWSLLQRDFSLSCTAVNTHFLLGMFGYTYLIGCKAYFLVQGGLLGQSAICAAMSGLCLMLSVVNRGVAIGGGAGTGLRYGQNIFSLLWQYGTKLIQQATSRETSFGFLEMGSVALLCYSAFLAIWSILTRERENSTLEESESLN